MTNVVKFGAETFKKAQNCISGRGWIYSQTSIENSEKKRL